MIVGLTVWDSYFAKSEIPVPDSGESVGAFEESERLREGTTARLMVAGSADMVANNIAFMLNLADWMVQDEALINIRSKVLRVNTFEPLESTTLLQYRLFNLFGGSILLFDYRSTMAMATSKARREMKFLLKTKALLILSMMLLGVDMGCGSESIIIYSFTRYRFDHENRHFEGCIDVHGKHGHP